MAWNESQIARERTGVQKQNIETSADWKPTYTDAVQSSDQTTALRTRATLGATLNNMATQSPHLNNE
jgi:hypothetical protein